MMSIDKICKVCSVVQTATMSLSVWISCSRYWRTLKIGLSVLSWVRSVFARKGLPHSLFPPTLQVFHVRCTSMSLSFLLLFNSLSLLNMGEEGMNGNVPRYCSKRGLAFAQSTLDSTCTGIGSVHRVVGSIYFGNTISSTVMTSTMLLGVRALQDNIAAHKIFKAMS